MNFPDPTLIGKLHTEPYSEWEKRFLSERGLDPRLARGKPGDGPLCAYSAALERKSKSGIGGK